MLTNSHRKQLMLNTVSSLLLQIITIVSGLILPRVLISFYGSEINGLVSSITKFLSLITFLELGIGAVFQSSLYKPLADGNNRELSAVISSGRKFYYKIAYFLIIYVIFLIILYPIITDNEHKRWFIISLIISISLGFLIQYLFGAVDRLLLNADQKVYLQSTIQILMILSNLILCIVLIRNNYSIQVVKLLSSVVFIVGPVALHIYVNKHYSIDKHVNYIGEPIKQKWNGIAQHISYVVLEDTDTIVLTLFSTLTNVSIYNVYYGVVNGIKQIAMSIAKGVEPVIGNSLARNEDENLLSFFSNYEYLLHIGTIYFFTITGILLLPFVEVYLNNVADLPIYIQPVFAILIVVAHGIHTLRTPYNSVIIAAGHFKQTQGSYIISAAVNIVVSAFSVHFLGLIGVAIGTLIAMAYQTVWMALYVEKAIITRKGSQFFKQLAIDILLALFIIFSTNQITLGDISYLSWFIMALKISIVSLVCLLICSFIFRLKATVSLFRVVLHRMTRRDFFSNDRVI